MRSQEVFRVSNSWIPTVTTCFFLPPLPQEQGQWKMTLTSGGMKGLIYETRPLPWDVVPGIPAESHLPPTQGHHHMNVNQTFPALSGLSGAKLHFPFSSSFHFSWAKLLCCCPLSHWQQHDVLLKATGTYRMYIALPPGESGLENNTLAAQIIAYTAHWPQSEKFDSNTKRWKSRGWKIFFWAFVQSIGFSVGFKQANLSANNRHYLLMQLAGLTCCTYCFSSHPCSQEWFKHNGLKNCFQNGDKKQRVLFHLPGGAGQAVQDFAFVTNWQVPTRSISSVNPHYCFLQLHAKIIPVTSGTFFFFL